jgi:hypothetical protein
MTKQEIQDAAGRIIEEIVGAPEYSFYGPDIDIITAELTKLLPRWIPVSESLPRTPGDYLTYQYVLGGSKKVVSAHWFGGRHSLDWYYRHGDGAKGITHWQPLPALPEQP